MHAHPLLYCPYSHSCSSLTPCILCLCAVLGDAMKELLDDEKRESLLKILQLSRGVAQDVQCSV